MNNNIFLTVIIPAYNEEKNIQSTLSEIHRYLKDKDFTYEIIVVDDGSTDRTVGLAESSSRLFPAFKLLKNETNRGKGYSVRRAMLSSRGEYSLFMDADNSTSIYEFDKFLPLLRDGYDIVISSRRLKDSVVNEPQPLIRAKMGQFYIFLSKIILGLDFRDFNCGFKVFKTRSTRRIFELQKMSDWSFDVELLYLANKFGLRTIEAPVRWVHKSGSKVKPFKDAIRSFISILSIKLNDLNRNHQ